MLKAINIERVKDLIDGDNKLADTLDTYFLSVKNALNDIYR